VLDALLNPTSIAVVGASQRRTRGTTVLLNLKRTGFGGRVYAINPRYQEVEGYPCYPSVSAIPHPVDCVVLGIPADGVPGVLEDAHSAGARAAVVLSSGFGEGGHADAERVAKLTDLAGEGMSICGPNCYGVFNLHTGAAAFSGHIAEPLLPGPVAIVSQSGGFSNVISDPLMLDRGIGCSFLVSCGNQLGVTIEDYLDHLLDDPNTHVIGAFVEGFREPQKLAPVAARARRLGKPIVVLKSGRSEAGREAARSHTGSLAGSGDILSALLRRHGLIEVGGIDELIETLALLAVLRNRRPFPPRMVVITGSGGEGSHVADAAADVGLGFSPLSEPTCRRIEKVLPDFGAAMNPVDGTGAMFEAPDLFPGLVDAVLADPQDGIIAVNLGGREPGGDRSPMSQFARDLAAAVPGTDKVVVAYSTSALGPTNQEMLRTLSEVGVPYLAGTQTAMRALASIQRWLQPAPDATPAAPPRTDPTQGLPTGILPFLAARDLLTRFDVPIAPTELASTPDAAVAAATRLGYPVALKIEAAGLAHKADVGGVALGCRTAGEVTDAFAGIMDSAREAGVDDVQGVLVQPMAPPGVEVVAGVTVDPIAGPAVLFGLGGIFVEAIRDTTIEVPPLTPARARDMILGIRGRDLLRGARGTAPADVDALARLLVGLGDVALACRDRLVSVDVNPVMVGAEGRGAIGVDALVELR
jgi:acetate---CoA ligase (ADP-forming)